MPAFFRQRISRRTLFLAGALALLGNIPVSEGKSVSAEDRLQLCSALGESIDAGWQLFHTAGNRQVLAVSEAQLLLVQQCHSVLYPSVLPAFYSGVYRLKGAALFFQERYEEALQAQGSAYVAALEGADIWNMAQCRTWQVYGYQALSQHAEAIQAIESALRLTDGRDDEAHRRLRGHLLACWSESATMMQEYPLAQQKLEEAAALLDGIEPNEEFDRMHWSQIAGNCALREKQYSVAVEYYRAAWAELPQNWIMRQAVTALPLAVAYARMRERDESLDIARKAVSLIKALNAPMMNRQLAAYIQQDLLQVFTDDVIVDTFASAVQRELPALASLVG